jgi:hypothetical protein
MPGQECHAQPEHLRQFDSLLLGSPTEELGRHCREQASAIAAPSVGVYASPVGESS